MLILSAEYGILKDKALLGDEAKGKRTLAGRYHGVGGLFVLKALPQGTWPKSHLGYNFGR